MVSKKKSDCPCPSEQALRELEHLQKVFGTDLQNWSHIKGKKNEK